MVNLINFYDWGLNWGLIGTILILLLLGIVVIIFLGFMSAFASYKDIVIVNQKTSAGVIAEKKRGKKSVMNSRDGRVEYYKIFRPFRTPLNVPVYNSEDVRGVAGKKGFLVEYVVVNDTYIPINSMINIQKIPKKEVKFVNAVDIEKSLQENWHSVSGQDISVEKVYTIDRDVRDWQATETRNAETKFGVLSTLQKYQVLISVMVIAMTFIIMTFLNSESINAITDYGKDIIPQKIAAAKAPATPVQSLEAAPAMLIPFIRRKWLMT